MNSKKKFNMGNIIAVIMLRLLLKMIKKNKPQGMHSSPPPLIIIPKKLMPSIPQSDLMIDRKRLVYNCGICGQKFSLKSDATISRQTMNKWLDEVKGHECDANKKTMGH